MSSTEIFKQFVDAINRHDVAELTSLMHADHTFVDSLGNCVHGAKPMEAGWRGYFAMCAGYWVKVADVISQDSLVLAVGEAGGAIDGSAGKCRRHGKRLSETGLSWNGACSPITNLCTKYWRRANPSCLDRSIALAH